jgi:hypothetical protein
MNMLTLVEISFWPVTAVLMWVVLLFFLLSSLQTGIGIVMDGMLNINLEQKPLSRKL